MSENLQLHGTLFGVSVGPGDPELLTLKAVRVIEECDVIAIPLSSSDHNRALEIAAQVVDIAQKRVLELAFPMTYDTKEIARAHERFAGTIANELEMGHDVAFLTLGDASVYSTFSYMLDLLCDTYRVEIIPGVTSFCAAAAATNTPLACSNDSLHVLPMASLELDDALALGGTVVLVKPTSQMRNVVKGLRERGLSDSCVLAQCIGLPNERLYHSLPPESSYKDTYFSTIIVRTPR